ncbi:unnamed protein product [Ophioblennius macclurei]
MEPDPTRNNRERSGFSRSRRSSILKAPRTSAKFPDPGQQENVVECAKPGEKRNSKRVSFAPANDVLLFSKDAKNTSPARSPFQDLTASTASSTLNSHQIGVTGGGGQKIAGMESLLNAPLHDYQQTDKVNFDTGHGFGERTVVFSAHESSMDMTQSHTINIAADEDRSFHNDDPFPTFPVNSLSADKTHNLSGGVAGLGSVSLFPGRKLDVSASLQSLDTEFENFLASLSKPADPSLDAAVARGMPPLGPSSEDKNRPIAQRNSVDVDEEKQTPPFVPITTGKTGRKSAGLYPEDEAAEAQTGDDAADPFNWLFPSEDMYANHGRRVSQSSERVKTAQQQSRKSVGLLDSTVLDKPLKNTPHTQTVLFAADDDFMELTQSHTGHIASASVASELMSANTFNPGFKNVPASHPSGPAGIPDMGRATSTAAPTSDTNVSLSLPKTLEAHADKENDPPDLGRSFGRSFGRSALCPIDAGVSVTEHQERSILGGDVSMDMTDVLTESLAPDTTAPLQQIFSSRATLSKNDDSKDTDCNEKTVRFTADDACMDLTQSHTVNIHSVAHLQSLKSESFSPDYGEKTVRFSIEDAAMDVTRSHTVNIAVEMEQELKNEEFLPELGEKTVRFTADDAAMDMTKSHTVNIAAIYSVQPQPHEDATEGETRNRIADVATDFKRTSEICDLLPNSGERTVRFSADDAAMDVTKSHTVNIATVIDSESVRFAHERADMDGDTVSNVTSCLKLQGKSQNPDHLQNAGEKTVRFSVDDAAMDMTKSHTVNIAADSSMQLHQNMNFVSTSGEKPVVLTTDDARNGIADVATEFKRTSKTCDLLPNSGERTVRFSADDDAAMEVTKSHTVNIAAAYPCQNMEFDSGRGEELVRLTHERVSMEETRSHVGDVDPEFQRESQSTDHLQNAGEKTVRFSVDDAAMDMTKSHTVDIAADHSIQQNMNFVPPSGVKPVGLATDDGRSGIVDIAADFKTIKTSPISSEASVSSCLGSQAVAPPTVSPDSSGKGSSTDSEPSSGSSPSQDADLANSRKSRRASLADLTSKVRRLSHMINAAPDPGAVDGCATPQSPPKHDLEKNPEDNLTSAPVEPEPKDIPRAPERVSASPTATPFKLETKQLMSRLSVGGFKPKLPQRNKPDVSDKGKPAGGQRRTVGANIPNRLSSFDHDVSDIFDEELGSYEDMSETMDMDEDAEKTSGRKSSFEEFDFGSVPLEDNVFPENLVASVHGQKRPLSESGDDVDNEKRLKTSTEMELHSVAEGDSNVITAPTTQTSESSSSIHSASTRCEATFESSYKQSFYECELEDYASDMQMKIEDGSITVLEFFKLFNIDFVIHNPRQSVCPGRLLSQAEVTAMDLLKNKHISRPKQTVYETDVQNLTQDVARLKVRMEDLEKPLKAVNNLLWEEMRRSEKEELKSFGVKLKERINFFRKASKAKSHEMKEGLYCNLVQTLKEEQQKLKGTMGKADEMLKSLDDCIGELQAELAGVEENGFDDKPSIKSLQEEMKKTSEAIDNNERRTCELEMLKKQNSSKLKSLNAEIQNLESRLDMLDELTEWRMKERRHDCTTFTFLHETMNLQLTYEKADGNLADNESECKITQINFNFELNEEKSQCHARLVHKLVSQFVEAESGWAEKFPTRRHLPELLRQVGLVVSHCRLLGEECQRLKLWGSMPFDILHIGCNDTRISIVFSSLKKFSKFQVVFAVTLINRLYVLQVESFENMIGSTTRDQIEEIVASFPPGKNLLTKIVKKLHQTLLC